MKISQLQKILVDLGLSDNEARVYLASLGLGTTTILKIARAADLKRTTVYSIVEALLQKGLIRKEVCGMKQLYHAESPERLEKVLEEKRDRFKKAFPDLQEMYNLSGEESFIKNYEGVEGMKAAYLSMLEGMKPRDEYLVIGNADNVFNIDEKFFSEFFVKRGMLSRKNSFSIRVLLEHSSRAHELQKLDKNHNKTTKILSRGAGLPTHFVLTPYKVLIHQTRTPISTIVIEDKSVIKTLQSLFDIIWNSIKYT